MMTADSVIGQARLVATHLRPLWFCAGAGVAAVLGWCAVGFLQLLVDMLLLLGLVCLVIGAACLGTALVRYRRIRTRHASYQQDGPADALRLAAVERGLFFGAHLLCLAALLLLGGGIGFALKGLAFSGAVVAITLTCAGALLQALPRARADATSAANLFVRTIPSVTTTAQDALEGLSHRALSRRSLSQAFLQPDAHLAARETLSILRHPRAFWPNLDEIRVFSVGYQLLWRVRAGAGVMWHALAAGAIALLLALIVPATFLPQVPSPLALLAETPGAQATPPDVNAAHDAPGPQNPASQVDGSSGGSNDSQGEGADAGQGTTGAQDPSSDGSEGTSGQTDAQGAGNDEGTAGQRDMDNPGTADRSPSEAQTGAEGAARGDPASDGSQPGQQDGADQPGQGGDPRADQPGDGSAQTGDQASQSSPGDSDSDAGGQPTPDPQGQASPDASQPGDAGQQPAGQDPSQPGDQSPADGPQEGTGGGQQQGDASGEQPGDAPGDDSAGGTGSGEGAGQSPEQAPDASGDDAGASDMPADPEGGQGGAGQSDGNAGNGSTDAQQGEGSQAVSVDVTEGEGPGAGSGADLETRDGIRDDAGGARMSEEGGEEDQRPPETDRAEQEGQAQPVVTRSGGADDAGQPARAGGIDHPFAARGRVPETFRIEQSDPPDFPPGLPEPAAPSQRLPAWILDAERVSP